MSKKDEFRQKIKAVQYENPDDPRPDEKHIKKCISTMRESKSVTGYVIRAMMYKIRKQEQIIEQILTEIYK